MAAVGHLVEMVNTGKKSALNLAAAHVRMALVTIIMLNVPGLNRTPASTNLENVYQNDKDIFIKQFNESKKKDDLSDSYLQGIYYICK